MHLCALRVRWKGIACHHFPYHAFLTPCWLHLTAAKVSQGLSIHHVVSGLLPLEPNAKNKMANSSNFLGRPHHPAWHGLLGHPSADVRLDVRLCFALLLLQWCHGEVGPMASQGSVIDHARTNNKDKWAHHNKWLLMGCRRELVGIAGWAPYVNSSLIAPNWSNLLESCTGTCASAAMKFLAWAEPLPAWK